MAEKNIIKSDSVRIGTRSAEKVAEVIKIRQDRDGLDFSKKAIIDEAINELYKKETTK